MTRTLAGAVVAVLLLAGCGAERPGQAVPSLVEQVAAVDQAVVDRDGEAARAALRALTDDVERAAADGTLAQDEADAILAAAAALLERLGEPGSTGPSEPTEPTEPESTEPPAPPEPEDGDGEDDEDDEAEGSDDEEGNGRGSPGKGKKKGHEKDDD